LRNSPFTHHGMFGFVEHYTQIGVSPEPEFRDTVKTKKRSGDCSKKSILKSQKKIVGVAILSGGEGGVAAVLALLNRGYNWDPD